MHLHGALVSSFLFVSAALAGYPEKQLSPFLNHVEKSINNTTAPLPLDQFAGVTWIAEPKETVQFVTGTFTVPTVEGVIGSGLYIIVGISTCDSIVIGIGIAMTVRQNGVAYRGFALWGDIIWSPLAISAGHVIKVTVEPLDFEPGTAHITLKILNSNSDVWSEFIAGLPLDPSCRQAAQWIIAAPPTGQAIPNPDFDTMSFTKMSVRASGIEIVPRRPFIVLDNIEHPHVETCVTFYRDYAIIVYVPPPG